MPIINWRHRLKEELVHGTTFKVISNRQMEENLHSDRRFVCTDANAFMRFRAVERHLRWPSQVTLSPPKAKLCQGHWQRFWAFAAGNLQCCCGHPSFWISKQHSVDFGLLIPAWPRIPFLITPPCYYLLMEPIYIRLGENFSCLPPFHCQSYFSQPHMREKTCKVHIASAH